MFSQTSVILGMCGKGGHAWQGGMYGWRHAWQGVACVVKEACMARGVHDRGHVWWGCVARGVCGRGNSIHGKVGMHVGGGVCMTGEMATAVDGIHPTGMHSCFQNMFGF